MVFAILILVNNEPGIVTFYCYSKKILNDVFSKNVPMNTKKVLSISFAAVFAVSLIFAQNAFAGGPPPFTASVDPQDKNGNRFVYSWDPVATLPKVASDVTVEGNVVGFGVAIVTFSGISDVNFTGATIHPPARDNRQHSTGWHPHTGTATQIEDSNEFCITSLNSPHAGMQNLRDTFRMSMSADDALNTPENWETDTSGAITFELVVDTENCEGQTPELKGGDGWGGKNDKGSPQDHIGPGLPGLKVVIDEIIFGPEV